ncbi:ABC-2 type transport system permease protein [Brevibacterium sp. Mu109]|uniref:ABC transporter permease n=1 Tax=Brevibacterium sp. Mu109 TaxID=1255669 RepID=UPI000C682E3E|nr:ABC transporter permease [Brevibacterium sp. Mu109]SMX87245.1 ABC-2 type transport system permease protein [Brevibacterium sp. Mu109]
MKASTGSSPRPSFVEDVTSLTGRHVRLMSRRPSSMISAIVLPLVFAALFLAVLGRPMERTGVDYVQYLLPAIVIQAMFFTAISASIWAAEDAAGGMIDRLRSLPISRTSPVFGLLGGELTRAVVSVAVLIAAGLVMGFELQRGIAGAVAFVLVALGWAAAGCMAYLVLGFAIAKVETVQITGGLIYYPLLLVSNLFVPAQAFPDWLRPIVENQPFSRIADALRAVSTDGYDEPLRAVIIAAVWIVVVVAVFAALAPRAFGRKA